jgi:hypothetical protein
VFWRRIRGRRVLVVPPGLAVGSQLSVDDRVVVVQEVHETRIVVEDADGKRESIDVVEEEGAGEALESDGE